MDEGKENAFDRREMVCDHWNHSVMGEKSGWCHSGVIWVITDLLESFQFFFHSMGIASF